jgi:hypothetical protein
VKLTFLLFFLSLPIYSQVTLSGLVDTFYAYDFNQPKNQERSYTTQPTRDNDFSLNLAYLAGEFQNNHSRGRLALQLGTSVTRNTQGEINQDLKYIQEAFIGKKISPHLSVDTGIMYSHIGLESWVSKENWVYTRALFSDNVPYYAAGVRFSHTPHSRHSFQYLILNGWGIMTDNNTGKSLGFQYSYSPEKWNFTYNNYFGDEKVVSDKSRFRGYHNFILRREISTEWQMAGAIDFGHQAQQENRGTDGWITWAIILRKLLTEAGQALALRLEHYADPHMANISTATNQGLKVWGASLNYDHPLSYKTLWRTELRGFINEERLYERRARSLGYSSGFLVTSLTAWF